ncbi:Na(+)/H(+) antiporter subunit D [Natrinema salsiterrestre]|uniref:Na(+)/H(+) antiporter subunit D n=1 Tax=Natrinema salsiterrestre TaxID=2950540 RepID=A0A9Q4L678_9EURY|nr:Na(+)/H(+) antiporter subunit D [Natrinema salsiterrestre]MDF9746036.1 Na(+)/H(+) antiporter subunit D [Natrinema salsiterrestre]
MEAELLSLAYPPLLVFAAALLVLVLPRVAGFAVGALSLAAVLAISLVAPEGQHLAGTFLGFEVVPFYVDDFSRMVGLGLGFLGVCSVIYAYSSEASKTLVAFALVYVASSIGAAFAGDWLVLLFMWELMAVTSTLVVWHYGGEAVRAGFRYALFHGTGGVLVMMAVAVHYVEVGTFVYSDAGIANGIPAILAVLGMGVNVAFVGFHTWLPDTYPRPHIAASVFLSVYTTKTSAFVLYRAFPVDAQSELGIYIAYMGGFMAVYGATFALLQHDMRALLSYHIQAQLGYIVAGIGMGTVVHSELAVAGAMSHLFNNILFKSLLFMAVGVVIYRTGEEDLYELGGLWREMPLTAIGFGLGALSITAIPGFNGYVSKGMLFDAANPSPKYYGEPEFQALYWLLYLGAIGTLLSFIKLGYYVFLHGESDIEVADAKPGQTVAMLGLGGACLLFGVWWQGLADLAPTIQGADFAFEYPGGESNLHPYSASHLETAGILTAIGLVGFAVVRKPLSKLDLGDPAMVVYPATYSVSRWTMLAVTETYAAVDGAVVGAVTRCYWIGNNPVLAVDAAAARLPDWLVDVDERRPTDGGRPSTIHLRTGIGTTVLLLTLVLTVILWLLVV